MPRVKQDPSIPVFDFQLNPEKPDLSQSTLNIYKGYLNKITAASYRQSLTDKRKKPILNKKDLLAKVDLVVEIINAATESRQIKCGMYSAVFYAIGNKNLKKNKKMSFLTEQFRKVYYDDKYNDYIKKKLEESTGNHDTTVEESS